MSFFFFRLDFRWEAVFIGKKSVSWFSDDRSLELKKKKNDLSENQKSINIRKDESCFVNLRHQMIRYVLFNPTASWEKKKDLCFDSKRKINSNETILFSYSRWAHRFLRHKTNKAILKPLRQRQLEFDIDEDFSRILLCRCPTVSIQLIVERIEICCDWSMVIGLKEKQIIQTSWSIISFQQLNWPRCFSRCSTLSRKNLIMHKIKISPKYVYGKYRKLDFV